MFYMHKEKEKVLGRWPGSQTLDHASNLKNIEQTNEFSVSGSQSERDVAIVEGFQSSLTIPAGGLTSTSLLQCVDKHLPSHCVDPPNQPEIALDCQEPLEEAMVGGRGGGGQGVGTVVGHAQHSTAYGIY